MIICWLLLKEKIIQNSTQNMRINQRSIYKNNNKQLKHLDEQYIKIVFFREISSSSLLLLLHHRPQLERDNNNSKHIEINYEINETNKKWGKTMVDYCMINIKYQKIRNQTCKERN